MSMKGLYTVIITPFDAKGNLDEEGLRQNLRFQIKHHVDGIIALGSTGETPTLSEKEKKRVTQIAVEEVKGKVPLYIGTGSYSTARTIEETVLAEKLGADGVMIVTPYYNKPTQEGIFRHFEAISKETSLPICVYNNQPRTAQNIETATLKRIAALPNITSVKEASGNVNQMSDVIHYITKEYPHFRVLSGDDALTLPLMALGGHGILSVVSNLVPGAIKELVDACASNNFPQARSIHDKLIPLFKAAFIETNPIPIKAAMIECGMAAGPCRLPLCDLAPANLEKLREAIKHLPKGWLHGKP